MRLLLVMSVVVTLTLHSVHAQPLERGATLSNGSKFLIDNGKLRTLGGLGDPSELHPEVIIQDSESGKAQEARQLLQSTSGWVDSFLIVTETQVLRGSVEGPRFQQATLFQAKEPRVTPWGESFLFHSKQGKTLHHVRNQGQTSLKLDGEIKELKILSDRAAIVQTSGGVFSLSSNDEQTTLTKISQLGFLNGKENVQVVHSGRSVLVWSPENWTVGICTAIPKLETLRVQLKQLDKTTSVKALGPDKFLAFSERAMDLIAGFEESRRFSRPQSLPQDKDAQLQGFLRDDQLYLITETDKQAVSVTLSENGKSREQTLEEGKVHRLVVPQDRGKNAPVLFITTRLEEPKYDNDGRAIYDLEAKKKTQKTLKVTGLSLYTLGANGAWQLKSQEPRANPVGPIEIIGSTIVFATQTEPEHQEGVELNLPNRYPYPAVVLRGLSLNTQEPWFLRLDRGPSPAKSRLPKATWPKTTKFGPIILTSEDDRVLAVEPSTGELKWTSESIKMDESSPPFYTWANQLGVVTTSGKTKALTTLDSANGKQLANISLSSFLIANKGAHFGGVLIICAALAGFIYLAGKRKLYIRKIAGLQALDEAVGRATEMGKPVLYVTGLADVDDIQTLASLSILSHVAKKTAEYDTPVIATTARAVVFSAAQEVVRDAYTIAGRPDSFLLESVRYITDDQFGYTAGVDGIMLREEPAANFYMGKFYAESLILAETGQAAGAIQMAGTAEPAQLPFFVAACDYTLIGEELFAASAYLSGEPLQVGSLRGQDVGKAIFMILLLVCSLWVTFDWPSPSEWMDSKPSKPQSYQLEQHLTAQAWPPDLVRPWKESLS